jgi:hypothetical protein
MTPSMLRYLEFLGGETDVVPVAFLNHRRRWILRTITWCVAIVLIYAFCGQSSKFIYIDF